MTDAELRLWARGEAERNPCPASPELIDRLRTLFQPAVEETARAA